MHDTLSQTASLLSDPGRAAILLALLDGTALPAGELARVANVAPQTASSHLFKLVTGRLLTVEQQGRHRYYRLASADVAGAVEGLLAVAPLSKSFRLDVKSREGLPEGLAYARSCYSHLAGQLAAEIAEALLDRELLIPAESKSYTVTARGRLWLEQLGIYIPESKLSQPRFARRCLDWTERRHHISGELGSVLLCRLKELKWIAPVGRSRVIRVTLEGERNLWTLLDLQANRIQQRSTQHT